MKQAICEVEAGIKLDDQTSQRIEDIARIGVIKDMALEVLDRDLLLQCLRDYEAGGYAACADALRRRMAYYWPEMRLPVEYNFRYSGKGHNNRFTNRCCRILDVMTHGIVRVEFDDRSRHYIQRRMLEMVTE